MMIVYCDTCGHRVAEEELQAGTARQLDESRYLCANCSRQTQPATGRAKSGPIHPLPGHTAAGRSSPASGSRSPKVVAHHTSRSTGGHGAAPAGSKQDSSLILTVAIVIGVLVGGLVAVVVLRKNTPEAKAPPTIALKEAPTSQVPATTPAKPDPTPPVTPKAQPAPTPIPAPRVAPAPPTKPADPRELAAKDLAEAKALYPKDPQAYKEKLSAIALKYKLTPAGMEAIQLLADLKLPDNPAPPVAPAPAPTPTPPATFVPPPAAGGGDWTPLFDGKSLAFMDSETTAGWKLDNGAIVNVKTSAGHAQSRKDIADGMIRFRFEVTPAKETWFGVRQGAGGMYRVGFDKKGCTDLAGKSHELIFTCKGDAVTATLDGQPANMTNTGARRDGRIKFAIYEGTLRLQAVEFRNLP